MTYYIILCILKKHKFCSELSFQKTEIQLEYIVEKCKTSQN